jgi:hypothetical protein
VATSPLYAHIGMVAKREGVIMLIQIDDKATGDWEIKQLEDIDIERLSHCYTMSKDRLVKALEAGEVLQTMFAIYKAV